MKILLLFLLIFLELISACSAGSPAASRSTQIDRTFVTAALATALDRQGRFMLPEPSHGGTSAARADSIARAAIAFKVGSADRGIELALSPADSADGALIPCKRRYYVHPVLDRLPADLPRFFALP